MTDNDEYQSDGYLHLPESMRGTKLFEHFEGRRIRFANKYMRARIYERDGGKCHYCLAAVTLQGFQADHVVPFSKGGLTIDTNLVCACRSCNLAKGDADYDQFVAELAEKGLEWRDQLEAQQAAWFNYQNKLAYGQM